MTHLKRKAFLLTFMIAVSVVFLLAAPVSAKHRHHAHKFPYNPVIFVHGGAGSGTQFESQAMRFTSNGYPQEYIYVHEYDSGSIDRTDITTIVTTMGPVWDRLDQLIAEIKERLQVDQVDVLGHSLGTAVMQGYLAFPQRAANVAHYVNIDGGTAEAPPGGVDTLAIWAELTGPGREITDAWNVTIPKTTHTEATTCAESFFYIYQFFTGKEPKTTDIIPQPFGSIRIAGQANYFPENTGVEGATLEIYKIDGYTGQRYRHKPEAVYQIDEDGNWGPFKAKAGEYYEFMLIHPTGELHPFYYQPFIRDDYFIRLNTSPETVEDGEPGGLSGGMDRSEEHANLIVTRNKEFWGDQGVDNDVLAINGVNIINDTIFPSEPLYSIVSAMFLYDKYGNQESDLEYPTEYALNIFFTGMDLYIPGAFPPNGSVRVTLIPRGGNGLMQVMNVPNWASSEVRRISVHFNDYIQADSVPTPYRWGAR